MHCLQKNKHCKLLKLKLKFEPAENCKPVFHSRPMIQKSCLTTLRIDKANNRKTIDFFAQLSRWSNRLLNCHAGLYNRLERSDYILQAERFVTCQFLRRTTRCLKSQTSPAVYSHKFSLLRRKIIKIIVIFQTT